MRKLAFPLIALALVGYKDANQVFQGSTPTGSGQMACSSAANLASWVNPTACGVPPASNTPITGDPLCGTSSSTAAFESAASCGLAPSSNSPTQTGDVLCATSSSAASFEDPATCGVAPTLNAPQNAQVLCGIVTPGLAQFEFPQSCGIAVSSNTPTASGNVLCATSSAAAQYETPNTCSLVDLGSTQTISGTKTFSATIKSSIASGSDAYQATVNGARTHFGAGTSDYASSDGTTVTFAGPLASSSTVQGTTLQLSSSLLAPVVTATGSGATTNQQGIETGTKAFAAATTASVTFSPAFTTSAPICVCTNTTSTTVVKCSATTTTLSLTEASSSSDTIAWICIGRK